MIVLLRHGATEGAEKRCIGRTDVPLSRLGRDQAGELARTLSRLQFARICASPLQRAVDTVRPLAVSLGMGSAVEVVPGLAEINMGEWDGLSFTEILTRFPEEYAERGNCLGDYRTPGGESFNDVADRALAVLLELAKGPLPVLCATHAGVIRSVLCRVTGHPMDNLFHFKVPNGVLVPLKPVGSGLEVLDAKASPQEIARLIKLK